MTKRFDSQERGGIRPAGMAFLRYWLVPTLAASVAALAGCYLSNNVAQVLATLVSVFSALLIGAVIPLLELKRKADEQVSGGPYWEHFKKYLGHAMVGVLYGLSMALLAFLSLIIVLAQPERTKVWTEVLYGKIFSPLAIFAVVAFLVFVAWGTRDMFIAYDKSHQDTQSK
ncbi:MAG: hypothetical protein ACKVQS_05890 [Fimbriimonadaceae bacterium]